MGNYPNFKMFENLRRGRQARNFRKNVPKILDLRKLTLGAPVYPYTRYKKSYQASASRGFQSICETNATTILFHGEENEPHPST